MEKPGEGKNGRVNASKPLMRPCYRKLLERLIRQEWVLRASPADGLPKGGRRSRTPLGHQDPRVEKAPTPFTTR
jgi:hypothetical protein